MLVFLWWFISQRFFGPNAKVSIYFRNSFQNHEHPSNIYQNHQCRAESSFLLVEGKSYESNSTENIGFYTKIEEAKNKQKTIEN
jgi:hypothetical protein